MLNLRKTKLLERMSLEIFVNNMVMNRLKLLPLQNERNTILKENTQVKDINQSMIKEKIIKHIRKENPIKNLIKNTTKLQVFDQGLAEVCSA